MILGRSLARGAFGPLCLAAVAALLWPAMGNGQGGKPAAGEAKVGINQNFIEPGEATRRQEEHNRYFLSKDAGKQEQILDLQTSAYALAERPAGLAYDTYSAIGYGLATSMMVVGPRTDENGNRRVVIIDTLEDGTAGRKVARDYVALYNSKYGASLTKLPIDAIIYTHNHIDHTGGVLGYLEMADKEACPAEDPSVAGADGSYVARRNCVEIICQEGVTNAVVNTSSISGRIIQARSIYMYGISLESGVEPQSPPPNVGKAITNGIGPFLSKGLSGFRIPSRTFTDQLDLSAAGINMQVIYVPSETNDELAVFVPDAENGASPTVGKSGLLFSAEVVQGPAFPNLYSLRGTQYRSPAVWFASVDKLRDYDSWCMVPSHGPPVCQRKNVQLLLTNFRDAIQFTHDQTLRFMNLGHTPDELVELVKVPDVVVEDLKTLVPWPNAPGSNFQGPVHTEDYLLPFYGSVPQGVRETYFGYVGWYNADPVTLSPIPPTQAAERMVALVNGGKTLLQAAQDALAGKGREDFQWAAELATILVRADPNDLTARKIKAQAYRKLGARALDPNWSDWYFTAANELDNPPGTCFIKYLPAGLVSPVIQAAIPISDWVNSWTWHLDGQRAAAEKAGMSLGIWFEPTKQDFGSEGYVLQLRHGIVEVTDWQGTKADWLAQVDVALQMSQKALDELILANSFAPGQAEPIENGKVTLLKGTKEEAKRFAGYFDGVPACEPPLAVPRS
ncbi:MAG TPA: alkyl sulfatase dimerization domain-containing protein [Thermoanaerobaculia bacterium]|nr:alkyl sulfatase dimerization domain-containing protein [Thermoanaerobaculia bacterium]